jgi:SulP family sulfate permease
MVPRLGDAQTMGLLPTKNDFTQLSISPTRDLAAGFTVALVALPLALAFGVASGLGAEAGITTAIIAGALAAIFGGSRLQVSGPTGAMTVILVPIFHQFGSAGVLFVGLLAGIMLIAAAISKVGEHVHRIPTAVIDGFTAGIGIVIALQQFANIFGVDANESEKAWMFAWVAASDATSGFSQAPGLTAPAVALGVAAVILLSSKFLSKVPLAMFVVIAATLLTNLFGLKITRIGELPARVGNFDLGFLTQPLWLSLLAPALAVAILAALESLLSAKVADSMRGGDERHDSNRELFGQGLANIVVPFFGGVAATAALARTAVNVKHQAQSKLAAFSHAAFLAIAVLLGASLVSQIPLAALAGVLLATMLHVIKPSEVWQTLRGARIDAAVFAVTFAVTIIGDLISAVIVGVLLSMLLRKTKLANLSRRVPSVDERETLGD